MEPCHRLSEAGSEFLALCLIKNNTVNCRKTHSLVTGEADFLQERVNERLNRTEHPCEEYVATGFIRSTYPYESYPS